MALQREEKQKLLILHMHPMLSWADIHNHRATGIPGLLFCATWPPKVGLCAVHVTGTAVIWTGSERVQPSRSRTVARLKNISTGRDGYRDGRHGPFKWRSDSLHKELEQYGKKNEYEFCISSVTYSLLGAPLFLHQASLFGSKGDLGRCEYALRVIEAAGRVKLVFDAL
ncbi:hypothetical protein C8J57DRAFT_1216903 [Mycena rebaudengoi]|nr:hypothetical protein C8J57DRAFT_1216903 [Mycena rebaudengoi]